MGYRPIPRVPPALKAETRLAVEENAFVLGSLDVEEFEWRVAVLLRYGRADEAWTPLSVDAPRDPGKMRYAF